MFTKKRSAEEIIILSLIHLATNHSCHYVWTMPNSSSLWKSKYFGSYGPEQDDVQKHFSVHSGYFLVYISDCIFSLPQDGSAYVTHLQWEERSETFSLISPNMTLFLYFEPFGMKYADLANSIYYFHDQQTGDRVCRLDSFVMGRTIQESYGY